MKGCGKFQQNLNPGFQFSLTRNGEIAASRRQGQNFKFHRLVLSKRSIAWAKNWHSSFLSWQWRAVEFFSKIWQVVSNSVKIYGKFTHCPGLLFPVPLHSLSLHKSCCYLFQCKASDSLWSHAMDYALYLCSMYPALSLPYLFLLTCYIKLPTYLIH